MLRAVYVRTLKPGVTDDEYAAAWMPEGVSREEYPAEVRISHSTTNERQTITTFAVDVPAEDLLDALGALVHPDWRERVAEVVESTEIETIFTDTAAFGSAGSPSLPPTR
jgi:hypothetical protein